VNFMFRPHVILLRTVYCTAFCLVGFLIGTFAQAQLPSGSCSEYRGTLGSSTQIGMSLYAKDQVLEGSYFYRKYLTDIPLAGQYAAARDISLVEGASSGELHGTFSLHFAESDPQFKTAQTLQSEVLRGRWTSADGKTSFPVYLKIEHDCPPPGHLWYEVAGGRSEEAIEKNVQSFVGAIATGNREVAAKFVSYPCTFWQNREQISLRSSSEFLKYYDQIFTVKFKSEISKGIPHHMFANWQGIMLANGAVWFDSEGRAKHFNNALTNP
jgi:hypothetical protein